MATRMRPDLLNNLSNEVNPDLKKERDTATFDTQELTHILDGGVERTKRRKELENLFFTEHGDLFSMKPQPFLSKSEMYAKSVAKMVKLYQFKLEYRWTDEDFGFAYRILNDIALFLHYTVFIPSLERLASDEQKSKWLPLALSHQIFGAYAQTELGHGTNLLGLETTATYDRQTEEFVLNTPTLSSIKWWSGGLGKSATHAMVLAQLVIDGHTHGLQPFLVQVRSLQDHTPTPGIKIGDIGPKISANGLDNGFLVLRNARIPREQMMMKNYKVTREGKFVQLADNVKANYATMVFVRVKIMGWSMGVLQNASTVAVRYSAVRRQTSLKPGTPEQQILDFQTQQHKVLPALASAYAFQFVSEVMMASYHEAYDEILRGNSSKLAELHANASGLKALLSDIATYQIETCRRACGGHGFQLSSGIAATMLSSLALVTIEGENTVLYLQTARYLVKQIAAATSGTRMSGSTAYMNRDLGAYTCPLTCPQDCVDLVKLTELYTQRAHRMVMFAARRLQGDLESGLSQDIAMNNSMVVLVRAAKAHSHLVAVTTCLSRLDKIMSSCSRGLAKVITEVIRLYCVHSLVENAADFLEMETMGLEQMDWLRQEELNLLAALRPNAVALVDAFDLHDETLASALGAYDGNVYQHLYESTQYEPMNASEVHPAYYKHLRGILKGSSPSKL